MEKLYTLLALGDSYTIGEGVTITESFPYQVVEALRKKGLNFSAPEIIAKTGWTTDELSAAIDAHIFLTKYDFVTILIGVNNQYRSRTVEEYKLELEGLLKKALQFADGKKEHVIVISIPDYSISPFAQTKDPENISKSIDLFNSVNNALSIQYKVQHIDISTDLKDVKDPASLFVEDGLHPTANEYKKWANEAVKIITDQLKK